MTDISRLEDAIKNGQIKAYYQPLIRSISGKICGAEALARWEDPEHGTVSPDDFVPQLEEQRIIHKLDLAMVENICRFYQRLKACGRELPFTINLSRIDFMETDMFQAITEILDRYEVPVSAIHIEITESTLFGDAELTRRLFDQFHDAGFEIWMDDFGSGYSSLNVLKDYEFDVLKIDMSILQKFDVRSRKILCSIINMSKNLGIHTLAEGVEAEEQLTFLKDAGCEVIQGYYFARPMCEEEFFEYLNENPVECEDEYRYWNDVGRVNFLSADPLLADTSEITKEVVFGTAPLAFIEYHDGKISYPYINQAYIKEIQKIGFDSVEQVEDAVNDERFRYYDRFMRQIERTIYRGGVQKMDNIMNDVVYTFVTKLIASLKPVRDHENETYLIASTVHTISSERSDYLVLKYSQSLYATYDLVTEITPEKDSAVQIFSNAGFSKVYGTVSLRKGVSEFAATEVHPEDQERYLRFFDLDTLKDRVDGYIQQVFSVRSGSGYKKKNIRISKLENGKYLYTIQSIENRG